MKTFVNYLGQCRIYSLIDLALLLFATKATPQEFVGVLFLHLGFLAYLEIKHAHSYRNIVPKWLCIGLFIIGIVLYPHLEVLGFLVCSYLYTQKNKKPFGYFSPIARGLQYFFLVAGIIGYNSFLVWIVLVLVTIRNFVGDLRDVNKDKKEGMETLPAFFGIKKDIKYMHLVFVLITSLVWRHFANLSILTLLFVWIVEVFTYNLTPR
jgi:4-hydroxybenzoate polyprenyltransferase